MQPIPTNPPEILQINLPPIENNKFRLKPPLGCRFNQVGKMFVFGLAIIGLVIDSIIAGQMPITTCPKHGQQVILFTTA